ncbi:MAG: hypothetical protein KA821_09340 [Chitinophagaceae bacterium]|nr:hypothetical protein [Chitinophagaceae bacterium]
MEIEKKNVMPTLKIRQLQYESNGWKRTLSFLTDENIHLKNRLSEILQENSGKDLLTNAENFQTGFLRHDALINLLKNDISQFDKLLVSELLADEPFAASVELFCQNIRIKINSLKKQFDQLKTDFNDYLLKSI